MRAIDEAGNVDPTPASRTFTVDRDPPDTTIAGGPPALTRTDAATFTFTSTEARSTFECRLDGPHDFGVPAACSSPITYADLQDGFHNFVVRAIDPAGNRDAIPASRTVSLDTADPDTTLLTGPASRTANASPALTFSSGEPGVSFA